MRSRQIFVYLGRSLEYGFMKRLNTAIILSMGLLLCACSAKHADDAPLLPSLQQAEELMFPHPDSALHLLQTMPMPSEEDRLQHATWALLMVEALYKTDVRQDDSLINIACNYFLPRSDAGRRALSLYLKGSIYNEDHHEDEALPLLLQASDEIAQTTEYRLGHLNEAEIGIMFERRNLYDDATKHLNKALDYALQFGDSNYIASSYRYLARIPDLHGDYEQAISLYKKGISFAPDNSRSKARLYSELANVYEHKKQYDLAIDNVKKALYNKKVNNYPDTTQSYTILARTFRNIGMKDSAIYYYKKAETTNDIYTARGVYRSLRDLNTEKGDYKAANEYADKLIMVVDSIKKADRSQALLEIQAKYDEQVLINQNNQLQLKADRIIRNSLVAFLVILVLASFILYKVRMHFREKQEEIKRYSFQLSENNRLIVQNQSQIAQLQARINGQQDMEDGEAEIHRSIADSLYNRNLYYTEQIMSLVPDFKKLKDKPHTLKESEISDLKQKVNLHFDAYIDRLKELAPSLTDGDLELCALIKLGFPIKDIAVILNIDTASVSTRKYRMQKRFLEAIGSFAPQKGMDEWLRGQ